MHPGTIGGIIGSVLGLCGGLFGCYCGIKNANGPRERSFIIKASIVCLAAITIFIVTFFALPLPYRWFLYIPYSILLPLGLVYWNKKQRLIRAQETQ